MSEVAVGKAYIIYIGTYAYEYIDMEWMNKMTSAWYTTGLRLIGFLLKRMDILRHVQCVENYHFTAHMWRELSVKHGHSPCVHHHTPVRKRKRNNGKYSGSTR